MTFAVLFLSVLLAVLFVTAPRPGDIDCSPQTDHDGRRTCRLVVGYERTAP